MSAVIVQELTGSICEACYALNSGIDSSYWEGNADGLAHAEKHETEWSELGHLVLDLGDDPESHFGTSCIVCGGAPLAGNVYDGTLTVFARA